MIGTTQNLDKAYLNQTGALGVAPAQGRISVGDTRMESGEIHWQEEPAKGRISVGVSRLEQIDKMIVDQLRVMENALNRILGGMGEHLKQAETAPPQVRPVACNADELDGCIQTINDRVFWLSNLVARLGEI